MRTFSLILVESTLKSSMMEVRFWAVTVSEALSVAARARRSEDLRSRE